MSRNGMKRKRRARGAAALLIAVVAAVAAVSVGTAEARQSAPVTLKLWYLGDAEAPGFQKWMAQNVKLYEKANPDVKIKTTLQAVDTWVQTQTTACKAQSGPDIWYQWTGTYALEQAWNGCTLPVQDVWEQSDIDNLLNTQEATWEKQLWWVPQFLQVYPIIYSAALFKKAGLDPNKPPTTWAQLIAACKKLEAAGITPFTLGLKDGWGGEIVSVSFQKQVVPSYDQLKKLVISGNFATNPGWKLWLNRLAELRPYFNKDINSVPQADAQARFETGSAAMAFGVGGVQNLVRSMQAKGKDIRVMRMPAFGSGPYATSFSTNASGWAVTRWTKQKEIAGDFLKFMQTPSRLSAWYATTNIFPASKQWNQKQATAKTQKQLLGWINANNAVYTTDFLPVDLDVNGNFPVFQGILGGKMTATQAAELYQSVATTWRKQNKKQVGYFTRWLGSNPAP